jgi:hypothetical protein
MAHWSRRIAEDQVPGTQSETFFRPKQLACERLTIPAALYNACRLTLSRCSNVHAFVPVRSMQIMAVIDRQEVIFVDSQDYAVQDGEGGKLICLAWEFRHGTGRDDLTEPAPIELLYYREDARQLHNRLVGEFAQALQLMAERLRDEDCEPRVSKVVSLKN